ncbi:J domain-containing protein [Nonomuraea gerenzanensis]|uniref:J domain-containing protein n=1 Tax=Nonomuraea gerenzanensis TaxID=93944 RepID=UPI002981E858|nr:J domain-containing protein [Nonomuraea gerenzanensis]
MFSRADVKPCKGSKDKMPCGRFVRWTRTVAGVPFAVDLAPHEDGNTAVWRDVHGILRSRRITEDLPLVPPEKRMMPHAATCPGKPRVQTPPPPPPRPPRRPAPPPAGRLYDLLGVTSTADPDDIRKAYRRLARQLHPDVNPDPKVAARFQEIGEAYHVLSDPGRRRTYDLTGRPPRAG